MGSRAAGGGDVVELDDAHVGAHRQVGAATDFGHRFLAADRVFVVFERQVGESLADVDGRFDRPAGVGVDPHLVLAAEAVADRPQGVEFDLRIEHAGLQLVHAVAKLLMELPGQLGHGLRACELRPTGRAPCRPGRGHRRSAGRPGAPDDRRRSGRRDTTRTPAPRGPARRAARTAAGPWPGRSRRGRRPRRRHRPGCSAWRGAPETCDRPLHSCRPATWRPFSARAPSARCRWFRRRR